MTYQVLKLPEVIARTGLSRSSIYRKAADARDHFPKQFKLSAHASGWLAREIDAYIEAQVAATHAEAV